MKHLHVRFYLGLALTALAGVPTGSALAQSAALRGLWVGQAKLSRVTEVTVPLDANNVPVAPNPEIPTATADQAQIRLILHVNGAGQVSLLKDVAVLDRSGGSNNLAAVGGPASEGEIALVSDPRLYGEFPPQPAMRFATVVFDFGDSRATDALLEVINQAATNASQAVLGVSDGAFATTAGQASAQTTATAAALTAAQKVTAHADVATAFDQFLRNSFPGATVSDLATNGAASAALGPARTAATNLQAASVFHDDRAVRMVEAVLAAGLAAGPTAKRAAGHNTASAFADVADLYERFIAGKVFSDLIVGGANAAANAAATNGASAATIRAAVLAAAPVVAAQTEALRVKFALYGYEDTRSSDAVSKVVEAIIAKASALLAAGSVSTSAVRAACDAEGRLVLASQVARYATTPGPSADYSTFVTGTDFLGSPQTAAAAAAAAAVFERKNSALYRPDSVLRAAKDGAVAALQGPLSAAARALRTELPLNGQFGPGQGDPRFRGDIKAGDPALGAGALTGVISLPANHPTNPFRHRRHPDHAVGFEVRRELRFDFDGHPGDPLARAGYGVDRITGTYREEVFGLHKNLGPARNLGLRVEGRFELNRVSLVDTLNAR